MASAVAPVTVWVGFMDVVPVIGTVKEGVEWVLALHEGNEKVVREKETLIKNLLEPTSEPPVQSVVEGIEKLSVFESTPSSQSKGEEDPEEAGASGPAGPKSITEVKVEELLEYVRCPPGGRKKATKHEAKEQAEVNKQVERIKKDVLEKIRSIKPDFVMLESLDTAIRSEGGAIRFGRGEHVFNNNILKFHSKVLKKFIKSLYISVDDLNGHTLDTRTVKDIETNMVVHFLESEFYVNANAVLYSVYAAGLRYAFHDVMHLENRERIRADQRDRINYIIDLMNNLEIYVDHLAKMKWIIASPANTKRFRIVKEKVVTMYRNERGEDWCDDVKKNLGVVSI